MDNEIKKINSKVSTLFIERHAIKNNHGRTSSNMISSKIRDSFPFMKKSWDIDDWFVNIVNSKC